MSCRLIVVALLLFCVRHLSGQEMPSEIRRSAFESIAGKLEHAEELLTAGLAEATDDGAKAGLIAERGWVLYLRNRGELARADAERALKLAADCSSARELRAQLQVDARDYAPALACLGPLDSNDRRNARGTALYGLALILRGRADEQDAGYRAIETAWANRDQMTEDYVIDMAEGELCLRRDRVEEAALYFQRAADVAPLRREPALKLEATAAAAVRVDGARASSAATLAEPALTRGDYATAAAECEAAFQADPGNAAVSSRLGEVHLAWAAALLAENKLHEARDHVFHGHNSSRASDRDATAAALYASIDARADRLLKDAYEKKDFESVLKLADIELTDHPARASVREQQIGALRELHRWPEVIRAYDAALTHLPTDGSAGLSAMLDRAGRNDIIHERLKAMTEQENHGDNVDAERNAFIPALEEAAQLESTVDELQLELASLYAGAQQWRKAVEVMDRLIASADEKQKARYTTWRENLVAQADFARHTGKNYKLATRLGRPLTDYVESVAHNPRTPVNRALEQQLPRTQQQKIEQIRRVAAAQAAYYARAKAAVAEAQGIKDRVDANGGEIGTMMTKSEFDDAVARGKTANERAQGYSGELDGLLRDFWEE